ncbi:MAG: SDR family oxidoreductase [Gammaproteobacteria bacterium]|nr:SDR family oxidoreductase [Gammaproteobacteria bacterium]MCP5200288.1 SDR family oxidoreductase [Gammaproteobacteria bacterium]
MDSGLFDLAGKVAVVTGGSRGIGLMFARAYVEAGMRVYIVARNAERCDAVAAELSAQGGACSALPGELSRLDEVERIAAEFRAREPALHVLVNNAGTAWGDHLDTFPEKGWDKVMDLNLKSPFFLMQKLLPQLEAAARPDDPARVLNLGSVDGLHVPLFENFSYAAAKAGLHHLTRMLASHLAARHINVNAVAPGYFDTDMTAPMLGKMGLDALLDIVPQKRLGQHDDMAGVAVFLAARASAFVTGVTLAVDGGLIGGS